jgi:hypothetical protein
LAAWLGNKQRHWQDVLTKFIEIGRGLEAAHAVSIAHGKLGLREVFIDERGQARVADMGLARAKGIATESISPADDQFQFCVLLYEALYGQAPFAEGSSELRKPPAVKELPKRIEQAIWKGLSAKPEERFPSMTALLLQIEIRRPKPISRLLVMAIGLSVVGFLLTILLYKYHTVR